MSQFDFPRINFAGSASINPPTGNNNLLLPLVLFDNILVKAHLPPRIYCYDDFLVLLKLGVILLPKNTYLQMNEDSEMYFEIEPINTVEKFKNWVVMPLGDSDLDTQYHEFYSIIKAQKDKLPLKGRIPAGWNYYGGMEFEFHDVKPISVDTIENQPKTYTKNQENVPEIVSQILNTKIDFKNEKGQNTAVMVDVIQSLSFYSQVFCDSFRVFSNDKYILKGKPTKASLRFLNTNRIVNQDGAMGCSGVFYCVIPFEDLEVEKSSILLKFYEKYALKNYKIKGLFIRYDLVDVIENHFLDYTKTGTNANPAYCKVVGSISPYLENDFKSITPARQMVYENAFFNEKVLGSFIFKIDEQTRSILLDIIGFLPKIKIKKKYKTYDLGSLGLSYIDDNSEIELVKFDVNAEEFSSEKIELSGGILSVNLSENNCIKLQNKPLLMYWYPKNKKSKVLIMKESEWTVTTDTPGLYINQGEDSSRGYLSFSHQKEPLIISVFRFGNAINEPIPMFIKELKIKNSGAKTEINTFMVTDKFYNHTQINLSTDQATNSMYVFYPNQSFEDIDYPVAYLLKTGFFINLKVLPKHNYESYFESKINFNTIYQELLLIFDVIYPNSSIITPFNEIYFKKAWKYIKTRLEPTRWNSYTFMPTSREMSDDLYKLICKWANDWEEEESLS